MFPSGVRSAIKLLAGLGKTALEALDAATGIDQLLLAGVERMALAANFNMDLRLGVTGVDHVAAGASDGAVHIVRMDALLHGYFTSFSIMIQGAILDICAHHNLRIAATSARHPVRTEQPSERLLKYYNEVPRICQVFFLHASTAGGFYFPFLSGGGHGKRVRKKHSAAWQGASFLRCVFLQFPDTPEKPYKHL